MVRSCNSRAVHCWLVTWLKWAPSKKLLQSIIFCYFFTCVEESIFMKGYMKARGAVRGVWRFLSNLNWVLLNINNLSQKTPQNQNTTLSKLDLKRNAYNEIFNTFSSLVEAPPWVFPLCLVLEEKNKFGIWIFLDV